MKIGNTRIALAILCLLSMQPLFGQIPVPEWAQQMAGTGFEEGKSIAVDHSGNVYITGYFYATTDFDSGAGTFNLTSVGGVDIFVQKLDAHGNFIWAKQMGGTGFDNGLSIAIDNSGNVYTTGGFEGTVDFDPGAGTANLTSYGGNDIFIQKLDTDGNFIWAKQIGGKNGDVGNSIAVDASNNIYITGMFAGTADFDPGAGTANLTSAGDYDIFVQKLDVNGDFIWARQMGGADWDVGNSIAVDTSGNVYTTGHFTGSADFDPGVGNANLKSIGNTAIFVQKLDTNGDFIWAKQIAPTDYGEGMSVAVDNFGNVYTTGYFDGTADFNPGAGTANLTSAGSSDIFIQKLNTDGDFIWAKQMGGTDFDFGYSIAVDDSGNVYSTGRFEKTADFSSDAGTNNLTSKGSSDIFIQKLDVNGGLLWAEQMGGKSGDNGNSIAIDALGNVYVTGWFQGTADFDPYEGENNLTSAGSENIFVEKLYPCYPTEPLPNVVSLPNLSAMCEIAAKDAPAPKATSNCEGTITAITALTFPITDQSITQIVWTYDDKAGNVVTQIQAINWTPMDVTTSLNGKTITANNINGTYRWLDCDHNYVPLRGETDQLFTATIDGSYAVEITENGCVDTSACISVIISGLNEFEYFEKLVVYPNPSLGNFKVKFGKVVKNAVLQVTDIQGKLVCTKETQNSAEASIELNEAPGIYSLLIISKNYLKAVRLIIE